MPLTGTSTGPARQLRAIGLEREPRSDAGPIRSIFRTALIAAGLPGFDPHGVWNTLARFGQTPRRIPEALQAWSRNLAHETG